MLHSCRVIFTTLNNYKNNGFSKVGVFVAQEDNKVIRLSLMNKIFF